MSKSFDPFKKFIGRFEKDAKGSMTSMLVLGIIFHRKKVWAYQIKRELKNITNSEQNIKNSSLYALLHKLENVYGLIRSETNEEDQRRYFYVSELGESEFFEVKKYWLKLMQISNKALILLEKDR